MSAAEENRILAIQQAWFPLADDGDVRLTLDMLKRYPELKSIVDDYKEHEADIMSAIKEGEVTRRLEPTELYANKTANAYLLAVRQKEAAQECEHLKAVIDRAVNLITDKEAREAVRLRYLVGYSYKETCLFMKHGVKSSTVDKRLTRGIVSAANMLKMWGMLG